MADSLQRSSKEEFDLQYESLKDIQASAVNGTAKVAGFLLLAMGWLATSNEARKFLSENKSMGFAAIAAVVATVALSSFESWNAFRTSNRLFRRLAELNYLPTDCYAQKRLNLSTLLVYVVGNAVLAALLITALISVMSTRS